MQIKNILISRTDAIGDVVLTLPLAGAIKAFDKNIKIYFLGRTYTKPVVELSQHIDEFINYDEYEKLLFSEKLIHLMSKKIDVVLHVFPNNDFARLCKHAKISIRVGTTNRLYHWLFCNKLVKLSRKNSDLHETQLNLKLLDAINITYNNNLNYLHNYYGFVKLPKITLDILNLIDSAKTTIILHPKSKGSAREWGIENFISLVKQLNSNKYNVCVSGTKQDEEQLNDLLSLPNIVNLCGRLSLEQFIAFINSADVLVAASTGPLHIAAALNKKAIGLFAPMRPIFPTRWAPIGKDVTVFVENKNCNLCAKTIDCACIKNIKVTQVIKAIENTHE